METYSSRIKGIFSSSDLKNHSDHISGEDPELTIAWCFLVRLLMSRLLS